MLAKRSKCELRVLRGRGVVLQLIVNLSFSTTRTSKTLVNTEKTAQLKNPEYYNTYYNRAFAYRAKKDKVFS